MAKQDKNIEDELNAGLEPLHEAMRSIRVPAVKPSKRGGSWCPKGGRHDWDVRYYGGVGANRVEVEKICRKCGKKIRTTQAA